MQNLSADLDWFGVDENESDHARYSATVDPIVNRAALNEHVTGFQMDDGIVELHIDLARHDDGVIDGIGSMVPRRNPGRKLDDAEDRAVPQRRADLPLASVFIHCVVHGKRFRGPDDTSRPSGPAGRLMVADLVDLDLRAAACVMAGDHTP